MRQPLWNPPPGFVYVFGEPGDNLLKVGRTVSLKSRTNHLRATERMPRAVILFHRATDFPWQVERRAHRFLSDARIYPRREWFLTTLAEAEHAINSAADEWVPS